MTMKLRLQEAVQENEYYFRGFVSMADLAVLFAEYPFEEDTLEKAAIHRRSMERGVTPFSVTLRAMPDTGWTAEGEDLIFSDTRWEIRDGKSRVAAVSKMTEENLADHEAEVKIFLLTKEKMENMEQNRI